MALHIPTSEEINAISQRKEEIRTYVESLISPFEEEYKSFAKKAIRKAFVDNGGEDEAHLWRHLFFSDHYVTEHEGVTKAYSEASIMKPNGIALRLCTICLHLPKDKKANWSHELTAEYFNEYL